jgi:uncharacterized membrane protein (UPF0182 family)
VRHEPDGETIDVLPAGSRRRRFGLWVLALVIVCFFGAGTALSYYVDSLWFESLGYGDVFWRMLNLQSAIFAGFAAATFLALYGSFLALKPDGIDRQDFGNVLIINNQPVRVPIGSALRAVALIGSLAVAFVVASGMTADWSTFALWW